MLGLSVVRFNILEFVNPVPNVTGFPLGLKRFFQEKLTAFVLAIRVHLLYHSTDHLFSGRRHKLNISMGE